MKDDSKAEPAWVGNRRWRRANIKQSKRPDWKIPDFMKGLSNSERMMLKKIGRGGSETSSRKARNSANLTEVSNGGN